MLPPTQIEAADSAPKRLLHPITEARVQLGGISHSNFYEIVKRGDIALVKIGRRSFVTDDALLAYVARLADRGAQR